MIKLRTFIIALVGVLIAWLLGVPLPFLLGPMFACLVAALAGLKLGHVSLLGHLMRTVLGVAVGSSITPALVDRLPEMALSVALVPVFLVVTGIIGYPLLHRLFGFDKPTSFYGSMPGGLQDMLAFGEEAKGDVRALSLLHATRVLAVVTALPFVLTGIMDFDLSSPPGQPALETAPIELIIMVICALAGWWIAAKIGLFGASILGPMLLTAIASLSDLIHIRPPAEAILAAQFFIGLGVGAKYTGITLAEVRHIVVAGLAYCAVIGSISMGFALVVVNRGLAELPAALLAFAPGGQAEMAVLAIVAGFDVAYVVLHHVIRLVLVITLAPFFARLLGITNDDQNSARGSP